MATEHILIPRQRYEQLLARMTQKSDGQEAQVSAGAETQSRRITPQLVNDDKDQPPSERKKKEHIFKDSTTANLTQSNDDKRSDEKVLTNDKQHHEQGNAENQMQDGEEHQRSLEEIQQNHRSLLPPGKLLIENQKSDKKIKERQKNKTISNKRDNANLKINKKNEKLKTKTKPYSVLARKWISL